MRKTTVAALLIVIIAGLVAALMMYGPGLGQSGNVRKLALAFMQDLQFKDFRSSSLYTHKLERDRVDIGHAIERLFLLKPEMLDIREFKVIEADIDDDRRARVKVRTVFQRLNIKDKPEDGEVVLYFIKRHPDCPIGAECNVSGTCINEFGKPAKRTDLTKEEKKALEKKRDDTSALAKGETYQCTPGAEHQWYMNLDSTLKEKKYNN